MNPTEIRYRLPKVSEIMSSKVIALSESHSIFDALSTFNKWKMSAIPVVEKETNVLLGIISEGDCLNQLAHSLFYDELKDESVKIISKPSVRYIQRDMDIFELESYFQKQGIRHAPVIDDKMRVIGTVSRGDILKHLEMFTKEVLQYRHDIKEPLELSKYKEFDTRLEDIKENHKFDSLT